MSYAVGHAGNNATSAAYEASRVINAAPARLHSLTVFNSKSSPQYVQLHDAAALPADTAVPVLVVYIGALATLQLDYGIRGRKFTTGIVVCNSSTGATKTIGSADCWFDAQWR